MKEYLIDRNKRYMGLSWILVMVMMGVIFNFSSQIADMSNELSTGITEKVVVVINDVFSSDLEVKIMNRYIRKNAHFLIYMALGVLMMNALMRSENSLIKAGIISFICSVLYAISDEFHQYFVPGRGPGLDRQHRSLW